MSKTKIEWTEEVLNAQIGCTKCSPGCSRCYAIKEVGRERCDAHRRLAKLKRFQTGPVSSDFIPERLISALKREIPTKYFVNSLSDFFHENAPLDWQLVSLEAMKLADWHVFQILTKRESQLRSLLSSELRDYATLPNVLWGVSVEDRKHGIPRIDALRKSPARLKWLSIEPLLEDLRRINLTGIDWVVVGGESGCDSRR